MPVMEPTSGQHQPRNTSKPQTLSSTAFVERECCKRFVPTETSCDTTPPPKRSVWSSRMERSALIISQTLQFMAIRRIWITSMHTSDGYTCPVCGFPGLSEPPYDTQGCAS